MLIITITKTATIVLVLVVLCKVTLGVLKGASKLNVLLLLLLLVVLTKFRER